MFNLLRSLFRPKPAIADPYEQFVVAFIEECERQGRKLKSYDHQARSFAFGDRKEKTIRFFSKTFFACGSGATLGRVPSS
jgi:hypothetical protein